jgi:hypothetical protein
MCTTATSNLRLMKFKQIILAFVIGHMWNTARSNDKNESVWSPVPPIQLPLDVQSSGNKIEENFQISEKRLYAFNLDFLFKENNKEDRDRVKKLSGGGFGYNKAGKQVIPKGDEGVPLVLKIVISKTDANKEIQIFQKEINTHEIGTCCLASARDSKELMVLSLYPGQYRIFVENIFVSPELGNTLINFSITFAYRGK